MHLIVGLGNPGKKYENTPHNAGFWGLDLLSVKLGITPTDWLMKFDSLFIKTSDRGRPLLLLKPQTFMNESGRAVQQAAAYYKVLAENIWLIHDDLDLKIGEYKITQKRPRTHNGLDSVEKYLGKISGLNYVRLGIMPPQKPQNPKQYVLTPLSKEQLHQTKKAARAAAEQLLELL